MEILNIFLAIIIVILIAIFFRLGSILTRLQANQLISNAYNDDHHNQRGLLLNKLENLDNISYSLESMQSDIDDIKYVLDIFYKYKLPNEADREFLDKIEIDNKRTRQANSFPGLKL